MVQTKKENEYIVHMGRVVEGRFRIKKRVKIDAQTHVLAAKVAEIQYPEMRVAHVVKYWYPSERCHNCGGPIFTGDFHNDQPAQRKGQNRCIECCQRVYESKRR